MTKTIYIKTTYRPTVIGPHDDAITINGCYSVPAELIGEQRCGSVHRGVALYQDSGTIDPVWSVAIVGAKEQRYKGVSHPVHHQGDHVKTFASRDEAMAYAQSLL